MHNEHDEPVSTEQPHIPFYRYLYAPPVLSSGIAMAINGIAFKPFDVVHHDSCPKDNIAVRLRVVGSSCNSVNFNSEWWGGWSEPMQGFLVAASIGWTVTAASRYVLQSAESYKASW